jgi:RNA polymerase sigma-70 factor (ECF subfamily)
MLRGLKPRARQLLWLAYIEGMTHREIAAVTALNVMSVRILLLRARREAQAMFAPKGKADD